MGLAEKRQQLLRIVENADEEMVNKLIAVATQPQNEISKFSAEELAKFHATRQKYMNADEGMITMEAAHAYIRSLKK